MYGRAQLEQAYWAARQAWPDIHLDEQVFLSYAQERLEPSDDALALHGIDLYLACACVAGVPGAIAEFERRHLHAVGPAVRAIDASDAFVDEVVQQLREKLFVAGKLADYSGRGSLQSWVSVSAYRIGLSCKRAERRHNMIPEEIITEFLPEDPELTYLKERYRGEFQEALLAALSVLTERERVILRLTLQPGLSHARIGAIYGVNQSTVTRWMTAARHRIWEELRRQLSTRLHLASAEVDSLIRCLHSDLQISLSRALDSSVSS